MAPRIPIDIATINQKIKKAVAATAGLPELIDTAQTTADTAQTTADTAYVLASRVWIANAVPDNSEGNDGDIVLVSVGALLKIYYKISGTWTYFIGVMTISTSVPDNSFGNNGDFQWVWITGTPDTMYFYVKTSGTWDWVLSFSS